MKINFEKISKLFPIIGIILFIYTIINIGVEDIANAFVSIPPIYYILASLLFIPRLIMYTYKWQYICKKQKMDFGFLYLAKIFMICLFYGAVTPGAIGWHIRILYLRKKGQVSLEKCISNSLIEGTTAFIAGLFLALIASILFFEILPGLFIFLCLFFIFYLIVFIVLMKQESGAKIFNIFIKPLIPRKYKGIIDKSVDSLYEDLPRLRDMVGPILLEIVIWIVAAIQVYIIAVGFGINVPFLDFILLSITSVVVAGALPITIGGLGVREITLVSLLSAYGVSPGIAFVISLSGFLIKTLLPGVVGWAISFKRID